MTFFPCALTSSRTRRISSLATTSATELREHRDSELARCSPRRSGCRALPHADVAQGGFVDARRFVVDDAEVEVWARAIASVAAYITQGGRSTERLRLIQADVLVGPCNRTPRQRRGRMLFGVVRSRPLVLLMRKLAASTPSIGPAVFSIFVAREDQLPRPC